MAVIHVTVSDNGFSGAASDGSGNVGVQGEPLSTTLLIPVQVSPMNDMPWLTWSVPPPSSVGNLESLSLRGLQLSDVDAARRAANYSVTLEALYGQIEAPSSESRVVVSPKAPYAAHFVRLQGTLLELHEALESVRYRPPRWFTGTDEVLIRASDAGGAGAGGNLTSELGFSVTVTQAHVPPTIRVRMPKVTAREGQPFYLGEAAGISVGFPAEAAPLFFRLSAADGALFPPLDRDGLNRGLATARGGAPGGGLGRYLTTSQHVVEGVGTRAAVDAVLAETRFLHAVQDWFSPAWRNSTVSLDVCMWDGDADAPMAETCAASVARVRVGPTDDAPVIYSISHPWSLPLNVVEDTPVDLCCFKIYDADLAVTGDGLNGAPWPLSIQVRVRAGNVSLEVPSSVAVRSRNASLVQMEGNIADLEAVLDTLAYVPRKNMNRFTEGLDNLCVTVSDIPDSPRNCRRQSLLSWLLAVVEAGAVPPVTS